MYSISQAKPEKTPSNNKRTWFTIEKKILAYLFVIILLVIIVFITYRKLNIKYQATKNWVALTENILAKTNHIMLQQKDVVIETRGFIITGDESILPSLKTKDALIDKELNELKALTKDDAKLGRRIDSLQSQLNKYNYLRQEAIEVRKRKNFDLAEESDLLKAANQSLISLNAVFNSINNEERTLLTQRKEEYRRSAENSARPIRYLLLGFIISLLFALIIIYRNFVKRNKAEEALRKSEGLIRGIIDHASAIVTVKDIYGKYILINKRAASVLNTNPDEITGKTVYEFLPKETSDEITSAEKDIINTKEPAELMVKIPSADGEHTFITSMFPLFDTNNTLYGIGATTTDITPLKRAHEALEKSYQQQQRFLNGMQHALHASSDLICIINERGEFVMVSDTSKQLLGYSPKQLMSKKFIDFVAEEDKEKTEKIAEEIMAGKSVSDFTNLYKKSDGTKIPIIWSAQWVAEDKLMYCIAKNGTEKITKAHQLAKSQSRLIHAQKIAKLGNWEWNLQTNEWSCSDEIYQLLKIRKEDTDDIQQILLQSIFPDDRLGLLKARDEALSSGKEIDIEHRIIKADKTVSYMHTKGEVSFDADQKPLWISGTMQDITDRKIAEIQLRQLNEELENKAAELKSTNTELERFAYVASHDLQEPLRMVSSFLSLLEKKLNGTLDDSSKTYIHFAVDGAERMKGLIKDLLQYSRVGSSAESYTDVDLQEVINNVLHVYEPAIKENEAIVTTVQMPVVQGNKTQLNQLFQNLIGNALKYRSKEKPIIVVNCKEQDDEWLFSIKDNGIGIDKKYSEKIFIIFQRLHNKSEYSGTGIGLAICKKIVEGHNGKIWVESNPDQGSTFYFTLKKHTHAKRGTHITG